MFTNKISIMIIITQNEGIEKLLENFLFQISLKYFLILQNLKQLINNFSTLVPSRLLPGLWDPLEPKQSSQPCQYDGSAQHVCAAVASGQWNDWAVLQRGFATITAGNSKTYIVGTTL